MRDERIRCQSSPHDEKKIVEDKTDQYDLFAAGTSAGDQIKREKWKKHDVIRTLSTTK